MRFGFSLFNLITLTTRVKQAAGDVAITTIFSTMISAKPW